VATGGLHWIKQRAFCAADQRELVKELRKAWLYIIPLLLDASGDGRIALDKTAGILLSGSGLFLGFRPLRRPAFLCGGNDRRSACGAQLTFGFCGRLRLTLSCSPPFPLRSGYLSPRGRTHLPPGTPGGLRHGAWLSPIAGKHGADSGNLSINPTFLFFEA
jgi:hypothetical protein